MMHTSKPLLPAYVILSPSSLLHARGAGWRDVFPFSHPTGRWAFCGRVALSLGIKRLKLAPGSAILVPSYFQGVEIDTLIAMGFELRFYRLDERLRPDLEHIAELYDESVSALYIIHYYGFPQNLSPYLQFGREKGIRVIEDCALSLFSRHGETWLGSSGDMALFSVYKTVPLPHGGYLVTKEDGADGDELEKPPLRSTSFQTANLVVRHLKARHAALGTLWDGMSGGRRAFSGDTPISGRATWNPRTLKYTASSLVPRLMALVDPHEVIERRRANYQRLHEILGDAIPTVFGALPGGACPLFYPVLVNDKPRLKSELAARKVESVNLWSQSHPAVPSERADEASFWRRHVLELPIHQQLGFDDIDRIGNTVLSLVSHHTWPPSGGTMKYPRAAPGNAQSGAPLRIVSAPTLA